MWQDHGQWKGDDLLAAARIVGRCAACSSCYSLRVYVFLISYVPH